MLAALLDGVNDGGGRASASQLRQDGMSPLRGVWSKPDGTSAAPAAAWSKPDPEADGAAGTVKNGGNLATALGMMELARGDVGLALTIPRQGLGNAALSAVGTKEQREKFGKLWIAMAITEPNAGSDSAAIRTSARLDGDEWVLSGEKIFVTAGGGAGAPPPWAAPAPAPRRPPRQNFPLPTGEPRPPRARLPRNPRR